MKKSILLFLIISILALSAVSCKKTDPVQDAPSSDTTSSDVRSSDIASSDEDPKQSDSASSTDETPKAPQNYDYAKPVPLGENVGDDYFEDAVFLGDSRTVGLFMNIDVPGTMIADVGLMVNTAFTKPLADCQNKSAVDYLKTCKFSKLYISLGYNELGWGSVESFCSYYRDIIKEAQKISPSAAIYIQSIMPINEDIAYDDGYSYNRTIVKFNAALQNLANECKVYFVDVAKAVCDSNGILPADAANDGVHLKKAYCQKWYDYLKNHAVK